MSVYCLKCKTKTEQLNGREETTSNGRHMMVGECGVCGTKTRKIVKSGGAVDVVPMVPVEVVVPMVPVKVRKPRAKKSE